MTSLLPPPPVLRRFVAAVALASLAGCSPDATGVWSGPCRYADARSMTMSLDLVDADGAITGSLSLSAITFGGDAMIEDDYREIDGDREGEDVSLTFSDSTGAEDPFTGTGAIDDDSFVIAFEGAVQEDGLDSCDLTRE